MKSGDIAGAEALCKQALETHPDDVWLKRRYGMCRRLQGDEETFRRINDELASEEQAARRARDMHDKLWSALVVVALVIGAFSFKYVLLAVLVVITIIQVIGYFLEKESIRRYILRDGLLVWAAMTGIFAYFAFRHQIHNGFKWVAHTCHPAPNVVLEVETAGTTILDTVTTNGIAPLAARADPGFRYVGADLDDSAAVREEALVRGENASIDGSTAESFSILANTPSGSLRTQADEKEARQKKAQLLNHLLIRAVALRRVDLVVGALAKGADPNFADQMNITPLGMATAGTNGLSTVVLQILLERGADPNRLWGHFGKTPFHSLIQKACLGPSEDELTSICVSVRLMLRHGADPNSKQGMFGYSPLSYAIARGADLSIVKILVEEGNGVVTDKMLEDAKDKPEILAYLKAKKEQQP